MLEREQREVELPLPGAEILLHVRLGAALPRVDLGEELLGLPVDRDARVFLEADQLLVACV